MNPVSVLDGGVDPSPAGFHLKYFQTPSPAQVLNLSGEGVFPSSPLRRILWFLFSVFKPFHKNNFVDQGIKFSMQILFYNV